MTIDRTYPIFTVQWLAIHILDVPTIFLLRSISAMGARHDRDLRFKYH